MRATKRKISLGYGFNPDESPHHFAVVIPETEEGTVRVEERFVWGEEDGPERPREPRLKVTLDLYHWNRIAETLRAQFNRRLKDSGLKVSSWSVGDNLLAPYLGKELVLLAWAVEEMNPTFIKNVVANWMGLVPEERWWLYTTINATSGHPEHGRDRGWRKAIRIALSENPAGDMPATGASPESLNRPLLPPKRDPEDDAASEPPVPDTPVISENHAPYAPAHPRKRTRKPVNETLPLLTED